MAMLNTCQSFCSIPFYMYLSVQGELVTYVIQLFTIGVISSTPPFKKEGHVRFTEVPFEPLSVQ